LDGDAHGLEHGHRCACEASDEQIPQFTKVLRRENPRLDRIDDFTGFRHGGGRSSTTTAARASKPTCNSRIVGRNAPIALTCMVGESASTENRGDCDVGV
jgi:hypothetical protein